MKISLMRHGEASWEAPSDEQRPLTERGREQVRANVTMKKPALLDAALFLSSPFLRACQTRDIAADILEYEGAVKTVGWLVPEADPQRAIEECAGLSVPHVVLFSHQPFSSAFVERFCGLDRGYITMPVAGLIQMEADPVAAGLAGLLWQQG